MKCENFVKMFEKMTEIVGADWVNSPENAAAMEEYHALTTKKSAKTNEGGMTEKGMEILAAMERMDEENGEPTPYTADQIAKYLGWSPKTVSGSMRKLKSDGYIVKDENTKPITYQRFCETYVAM